MQIMLQLMWDFGRPSILQWFWVWLIHQSLTLLQQGRIAFKDLALECFKRLVNHLAMATTIFKALSLF